MRIKPLFFLPLAAALGACTATVPPVEVTRFHLNQPIPPGGVSLTGFDGYNTQSLEFGSYASAVRRELARLGFGDGQGPYVAEIAYRRDIRDRPRSSGVSIGLGGGSFGRHGGVGLGGSFGLGGNSREDVETGLKVRIKRRGNDAIVWEGEAITQARLGAPASEPGLAADKLARALFADFPGPSGRTIRVP